MTHDILNLRLYAWRGETLLFANIRTGDIPNDAKLIGHKQINLERWVKQMVKENNFKEQKNKSTEQN